MTIVEPKLEDDLNYFAMGRRPQFFGKWKTTSILRKMEDDHNFKLMGDYFNFLFFGKLKTTSTLRKMKDDLIFKVNGRLPQFKLLMEVLASFELGTAQPQLVYSISWTKLKIPFVFGCRFRCGNINSNYIESFFISCLHVWKVYVYLGFLF